MTSQSYGAKLSDQKASSLVKRVDNFFYNTPDVAALAKYYSQVLGVPIRREQVLTPGLMWMEINVGGMELSFRKAEGTPQEHPDIKDDFLELRPGQGATISFEVSNTDETRSALEKRGVRFRGDTIHCTGGKELISIFEDPFGRPVQLYEPRFESTDEAFKLAVREGAGGGLQDAFSNLRDIRDTAMSISFAADDLDVARKFYGDVIGLPVQGQDEEHLSFILDGTTIEFRRVDSPALKALGIRQLKSNEGGAIAIEVGKMEVARTTLSARKLEIESFTDFRSSEKFVNVSGHGILGNGQLSGLRDPDGNRFELWQRQT